MSAANYNAPIKTMNCDCQKKQGMMVRHIKANYICFKVIFSCKQGTMHRETPYTIQQSVFAFATLPAQFALFMSPFQGCCWNIAIFNIQTICFYA